MARTLKKLSLQYQYLKLELEEVQEQMDQFQIDWSSRFGKYFIQDEVEVWENTETGERRDTPPEEDKPKKESKSSKLKKLYRALSTQLHPDKGGTDEQFTDLKEAYENDDILELVNLAADNDIEVEIEEDDIELIQLSIKNLNKTISEKKMTMIWQYYTGNDKAKEIVIKNIESIAGREIDPDDLVD